MSKQLKKSELKLLVEEQRKIIRSIILPQNQIERNKIIAERDNYKCRLCLDTFDLQVHHITPISEGGKNTVDNLLLLCRRCHHFIHYCNPMIKFGVVGTSHKELTIEGLKRARENGKRIGRPSKQPNPPLLTSLNYTPINSVT